MTSEFATPEQNRVHVGPVLPLYDDVENVKVFVFGDCWWPRPKAKPAAPRAWAIYWATPAFLRRFGIGVLPSVRRSIERERLWAERDRLFRRGLNWLCGSLLEEKAIERAVIEVDQDPWQVKVMVSKWRDGHEVRWCLAWYDFLDVIRDDFRVRINMDLQHFRDSQRKKELAAEDGLDKSGIYHLDLSASDMDGDMVVVAVDNDMLRIETIDLQPRPQPIREWAERQKSV